jgi:hypothetical protein
MNTVRLRCCLALAMLLCATAGAQKIPSADPSASVEDFPVAAIVNGDPIYVSEVEKTLARLRSAREAPPHKVPLLQA